MLYISNPYAKYEFNLVSRILQNSGWPCLEVDRIKTGYHEAGHAVINRALPIPHKYDAVLAASSSNITTIPELTDRGTVLGSFGKSNFDPYAHDFSLRINDYLKMFDKISNQFWAYVDRDYRSQFFQEKFKFEASLSFGGIAAEHFQFQTCSAVVENSKTGEKVVNIISDIERILEATIKHEVFLDEGRVVSDKQIQPMVRSIINVYERDAIKHPEMNILDLLTNAIDASDHDDVSQMSENLKKRVHDGYQRAYQTIEQNKTLLHKIARALEVEYELNEYRMADIVSNTKVQPLVL